MIPASSRTGFAILFFTFALAVAAGTAETLTVSDPGKMTGVEGTISLGPIHGGPIRVGRPNAKPFANVEFVVLQSDRTVASFKTDEQGAFRVPLPPGHYTVAMKEKKPRIGRYGPFEVDVTPGQVTKVEWHCDTGMR